MSTMAAATKEVDCTRTDRITRSLLGYGVLAGPVYVVAALAQGLLRPGFNLLHDDVSLLSNGSLGWIQIANFIVTGAFVIAAAAGMARALKGQSTWGPRLLGGFGAGLMAAGVFVADPMNGFPAGAPAGRPETISVHGILHIVVAAIGFLCLVASCFVIARRYGRESRGRMKWFSIITGVVFLLAFAGVASGSSSAIVILGFWAGVIVAFAWIATVSIDLYRKTLVSPRAA
ncbi:MAG TPA: DUF998 domain-containing protein [Candidatus Dormibacteraeota bacterium]|nr:DUF998 domain-containing protein [Candidatus Dormibacteraeota bacterium]